MVLVVYLWYTENLISVFNLHITVTGEQMKTGISNDKI